MTGVRVDMHAHFLPQVYRRALADAGIDRPDGIRAVPKWSEEHALATMDRLDVELAILSISSPGVHFGDDAAAALLARQVNEEAASLRQRHPGRFGSFASLPLPDLDASLAETAHALDTLGAEGVALETNHHGTYLGDPVLEPLWSELSARNAVVFVHPTTAHCGEHLALGYPRPMLEFMFETTRSITDLVLSGVLERHPGLQLLVPHAGAALPVLAARVELLLPLLAPPRRADTPKPAGRSAQTALRPGWCPGRRTADRAAVGGRPQQAALRQRLPLHARRHLCRPRAAAGRDGRPRRRAASSCVRRQRPSAA